ncbi:MAG: DUF2333 family protein, partial [Treponema sp.]|nr:DUF2333 family protein [Treponema sp.]
MPKVADQFILSKNHGYRRLSLTAESGLPDSVWRSWRRKSFRSFPDDLAGWRFPASESEAKRACRALIEYLKKTGKPKPEGTAEKPLVPWLLAFWTPESEY